MKEVNEEVIYRVSFAVIDKYGARQVLVLPGEVPQLLFLAHEHPLIPRVGEIVSLQRDLIDLQARSYEVIAVEHGISSYGGRLIGHQVIVVLADA